MSETTLIHQAGSTDAEPGAAERKRILLVEGDGFTRLVLLLRLRLAGFGVAFTSNGILGLGKLRSCHPDILLVELKLCGLSGLELIKAARAEPTFGDRPIYVFTHASRMSRATRKEVELLATALFDKSSVTREDLVQIFATTFSNQEPTAEQSPASVGAKPPASALSEVVLSGAIEELIAGVREQSELLAGETGAGSTSGSELLSRVSSLASCAKAAKLPNLARQATALKNFLSHLCRSKQVYTDAALSTVTRAVEVMSSLSFEITHKEKKPSRFSAVLVDEASCSNRAMEEALRHAEFEPVCFGDPARAREYLASNRTDLILANVVLPEAHGLALADIRQLPLHAKTPVLFGPESIVMAPPREEPPMGAPRLDKTPIFLTELVVRALNAVQSAGTPAPSVSPAPNTTRQPLARPGAAASLSREDGFELFAQTPRQEAPRPFSTSVAAHAVHPHLLFNTAGITSEPILRAEPGMPADREVKFQVNLPVTTIDESQIEERPLEALPPSSLQAEVPQPPQPEPTVEDQAAATAWVAAASGDTGQPVPSGSIDSQLEQSQAAAVQQLAASTPNYGELMNNQSQAEPDVFARRDEASQTGEARNQHNPQREDLVARVCAAEMALYHTQAEIEQRNKAIESLQKQLAEAKAATDTPAPASGAEQKAQARCAELEQEVAALRQAFEGLNGGLGDQQQGSPEAGKHVQELEQRLSQNAAEREKQKEEQQRAEAELRDQVEAAKAASQQSEAARRQAEARCAQLEHELANLPQAKTELPNPSAEEQKANAEPALKPRQLDSQPGAPEAWKGLPASELEQQVTQGVAALARATAELAKERGERQRNQQRAADLNGRLQVLHEDFSRTLQAQREDLARISALEQQHDQTTQALERSAAYLEQLQAERRLAEEQFQKAKESNAQLRKDLAFFEEANKKSDGARQELQTRLEASLNTARENEARLQQESAERKRLADSLEEARRELQNQSRTRATIEQELQTTREALQDREAKLHKEAAERHRLDEAQDSAQRDVWDGSDRDLEFSKVKSALQLEQVERKRQETQLVRMRQSALDAAHAARALRTGLRRQIREPVDNLVHSTRSLLELEMDEEQKKLAEAVLQDVLLVQTRLREPGLTHADSPESAAPPPTTAP